MKICIFCGANASLDPEVNVQVEKITKHFAENKVELVYGGAGIGIMGALATELVNKGGVVTGVIPQRLMKKEIAHGGLSKLHVVSDMHERKKMMYDLSDAFLIFPGGMGTMDELFEILTWRQLGIHQKPIAIFNINHYYDDLLKFLNLATEKGLIKAPDRELLFDANNWDDIWNYFKGAFQMKIELVPYNLQEMEEAEELFKVIQEYYTKSPWPPSIEKIMKGSVVYFRAILEGKQIGITGYTMKTPTLAETVKTTVLKEFQGKGYGKHLSLAIEEECKRIGIKKVLTTIYYFNHAMIGIKLKQGYTIEGYHPDHEAPGFHEYSLGKILK